MPKCPHCKAGFEQPSMVRIKPWRWMSTVASWMVLCPSCDTVLGTHGA